MNQFFGWEQIIDAPALCRKWTLARPEFVPTPASGNQKYSLVYFIILLYYITLTNLYNEIVLVLEVLQEAH